MKKAIAGKIIHNVSVLAGKFDDLCHMYSNWDHTSFSACPTLWFWLYNISNLLQYYYHPSVLHTAGHNTM